MPTLSDQAGMVEAAKARKQVSAFVAYVPTDRQPNRKVALTGTGNLLPGSIHDVFGRKTRSASRIREYLYYRCTSASLGIGTVAIRIVLYGMADEEFICKAISFSGL